MAHGGLLAPAADARPLRFLGTLQERREWFAATAPSSRTSPMFFSFVIILQNVKNIIFVSILVF